VLSEGVVGITDGDAGGGAFSGCRNLVEVVLPESCTSIGVWAFWGCTSLTTSHPPRLPHHPRGVCLLLLPMMMVLEIDDPDDVNRTICCIACT
jgi:hypothetical protein